MYTVQQQWRRQGGHAPRRGEMEKFVAEKCENSSVKIGKIAEEKEKKSEKKHDFVYE